MSKGKWKKPLNILLSAGLVTSLGIPVVPTTAVAATAASDLLISEYVEGSSINKAIELYNGTGKIVDLSTYSLELLFKWISNSITNLKVIRYIGKWKNICDLSWTSCRRYNK